MVSLQSTFSGRWGHPLLSRNLTLVAQGPVSVVAEDLLLGLRPACWTFDSKTPSWSKENQTQFQEQGEPEDGE